MWLSVLLLWRRMRWLLKRTKRTTEHRPMELTNLNIFSGLTDKQREERKQGIGGSDAAAVLNRSRYANALDVYQNKLGYSDGPIGNLSMALGDFLEDFVLNIYATNRGLDLEKPKGAIAHSKYPWMRCNLDFISTDQSIIGEIKTSKVVKDWGVEGTDDIPIEYLIQCAHNRIVAADHYGIDYEKMTLVVLVNGFGKPDMKEYFYTKNEKLEKFIIQMEKEFWNEHVLKETPPDNLSMIQQTTPIEQIMDEAVVADNEIFCCFEKYEDVQQKIKEYKKEAEELKNELAKVLSNKCYLVTEAGEKIISYKPQTTQRFDVTRFKKDREDLYKQYIKETVIRPMRINHESYSKAAI